MIALPELVIVLGVFALMGGYIALIRYILTHADGKSDSDSNGISHDRS
jgi:hypothetical protein